MNTFDSPPSPEEALNQLDQLPAALESLKGSGSLIDLVAQTEASLRALRDHHVGALRELPMTAVAEQSNGHAPKRKSRFGRRG